MIEELTVIPLGGGQEVGKSCLLLRYKDRNVLLDCGIHPGKQGFSKLPAFDALTIDPSEIDLVLITRPHTYTQPAETQPAVAGSLSHALTLVHNGNF